MGKNSMVIPDKMPQPGATKHSACNVLSLDNKVDKPQARINFQRDTANCRVMPFTETWLDSAVPNYAFAPAGLSIYQKDMTTESGKCRGGGVRFIVNSLGFGCKSTHNTSLTRPWEDKIQL